MELKINYKVSLTRTLLCNTPNSSFLTCGSEWREWKTIDTRNNWSTFSSLLAKYSNNYFNTPNSIFVIYSSDWRGSERIETSLKKLVNVSKFADDNTGIFHVFEMHFSTA